MLLPLGGRPRLAELVPDHDIHRVRQELGFPVAGQVDLDGGLARAGEVDLVIGPRLPLGPRVLDPSDVLAEVGAGDEVGLAVAVDVDRESREVIEVRPLPGHVADLGRGPVGGLVPGVPGDDVELAVAVDVEDARRLELALAVDRVLLPLRFPGRRAPRRQRGDRQHGQETGPSHHDLSFKR
jgi:hypothetical protein